MATKTAKKPKPAEVRTPAPAPATPGAEFRGRMPLARLAPSPRNPRKTFDEAGLRELADSFGAHGVLMPLLVRPVKAKRRPDGTFEAADHLGTDTLEVLDGERRFRAAKLAGLADVPVTARVLSDEQALLLMLIANDQREDVKPSERAAAYAALGAAGQTAEQISAATGVPLSAVRDLLRLARLPAWALAAVDAGTLPLSTAALVAKVPGEAAREKAAAQVLTGTDDWGLGDGYEKTLAKLRAGKTPAEIYHNWDGPKSYREAKECIGRDHTRQLKGAPFSLKLADLTPAGSCDACPKRAGNDPEAKADGVRADVCLDPDCYREKVAAHDEQERARFRKRYKLEADADVNPDGAALDGERPARGWLDWNGPVGGSEIAAELHPKLATRKVSEVVLECPVVHGCRVNLVLDEKHRPRVLVRTADARKTLTAAGVIKKPERVVKKSDPGINPAGSGINPARSSINPSDPKPAEKPLLADELEVEERAAAIACRVLGEYAGEQCEALDDVAAVPDADHGRPVHDALRFVARFLVQDHFDFGSERAAAVRAALGLDDTYKAREQAPKAIDGLSSSKLLALCVRLAAAPLLVEDHAETLPQEMLDWAELDWANLTDQARRELAGGPTAEEKVAAAEAREAELPPIPPIDERPDRNTPEGALFRAIHSYEGAADRWAKVKAAGATDAELKEQIGEALGSEGGSYGPGKLDVQYKGGKNPAVWIGDVLRTAKPTLTGKPLVDKVRELLGIPLPGKAPPPAHGKINTCPRCGRGTDLMGGHLTQAECDAAAQAAAPVSPIPVGSMLQDLDVPPAVLDILEARETPLHGVAEAWAACEAETPELAALPPRNRLMAWLVKQEATARHADLAAAAIAGALPGDAGPASPGAALNGGAGYACENHVGASGNAGVGKAKKGKAVPA